MGEAGKLLAAIRDWVPGFVATLGGTAVVLGGLFTWLGKRYLDKLLEAERNRNAAAIEQLKASHEKQIHVYKAQFELEFKAYQEIWTAADVLMDDVARFVRLYQMVELPNGHGEKRKYAKAADAAFFAASNKIRRYRPFIFPTIYDLAIAHAKACKDEIDAFFGAIKDEADHNESYSQVLAAKESKEEIHEITEGFWKLADCIRDRVASLSVIDA